MWVFYFFVFFFDETEHVVFEDELCMWLGCLTGLVQQNSQIINPVNNE